MEVALVFSSYRSPAKSDKFSRGSIWQIYQTLFMGLQHKLLYLQDSTDSGCACGVDIKPGKTACSIICPSERIP